MPFYLKVNPCKIMVDKRNLRNELLYYCSLSHLNVFVITGNSKVTDNS